MPQHDCETFDFPVKQGSFEFVRVSRRTSDELQQTLKLAKEKAETDGNAAMQDEHCKPPCLRDIYVETTIDSIHLYEPSGMFPLPSGKGGGIAYVSMAVGVSWQAGILCYKRVPKSQKPKGSGDTKKG